MTADESWGRKHYEPGGGNAAVLYAVFGSFREPLNLEASKYRSSGIPDGVEIAAYYRETTPTLFDAVFEYELGETLRRQGDDVYVAVAEAPMCLLVRGSIADPPDLIYLRDLIGLITAMLDNGAVAVLDWPAFLWYSPANWRDRIFAPDKPYPRNQCCILISEAENGRDLWIHTRGVGKFGRPDISLRPVPPQYKDLCIDLCNRFIEMLAFGARIPDGQRIRMAGLPDGLFCSYAGSMDDPEFNNVHVEIPWPIE